MKFQQTPYSCGAAAVVNALRCFGRNVPEKTVRVLAGTTEEDGTSDQGILGALEGLGFKGHLFDMGDEKFAAEVLRKWVDQNPVILCVQDSLHWVTVVGCIDGRFILVDPANTVKNKKENGVHVLDKKQVVELWGTKEGRFFGIAVSK